MSWFTVEAIDNKTYIISEYEHWEEVHSYLLIGETAALLIDSGLGIGNIREEIDKLTDLPVRVVSTHIHWDHIGGHKQFDYIYVHENELTWLIEGIPVPIDNIKKDVVKDVKKFPKGFNIAEYTIYTGQPSQILRDGDIIDIGKRKIEVIHTPGHAPGHICLYDIENNYLFTGDLIYKGTLFAFYPSTNPIEYKNSIEKILKYKNIRKYFPAHYDLSISQEFIKRVYNAFVELGYKNKLKQGSGIFKFSDFSIHI